MKLTTPEKSERRQAKITDSSGEEIGSISQNPEAEVIKISLKNVGDSREAASRLRDLADLFDSDSSNGDSGATNSPAEARTDTEEISEAEAAADESTDIRSSEDLSTWVAGKQANEASPTPGKQIREVRVESWLQVPEVLRALHNNEGPLRITYPETKDSAIAAEQTAISKFLIENAGENLAGMLAALGDNIANCHMVSSGQVSNEVAKEYLQRFSETISEKSSPLLTVAEVVRLDDSFKPLKSGDPSFAKNKITARDQILATITETMANTGEHHTCIIEVPDSHVEIAKMFINKKWTDIPEDERPPTEHTKVWVADEFVSGASITEYDFEEFLRDAKNVPERRQKKKKEESSPTTPGDVVLSSS